MDLSLPFQHSYNETPEVPVAAINPQTGGRFEFSAVVDTGADGTLLDSSIAQEIGIDLQNAPPALVGGIGGVLAGAKSGEVVIELLGRPELRARIRVSFAPGVAADFGNLLGLNFWLTFDLGLVHSSKMVGIGPTDSQ